MSSTTKTIFTVVGFVLIAIGFLTIMLNFVGLDFTFTHWLQSFGAIQALVAKIGIIITGFVLLFFGQADLDQEEIY